MDLRKWFAPAPAPAGSPKAHAPPTASASSTKATPPSKKRAATTPSVASAAVTTLEPSNPLPQNASVPLKKMKALEATPSLASTSDSEFVPAPAVAVSLPSKTSVMPASASSPFPMPALVPVPAPVAVSAPAPAPAPAPVSTSTQVLVVPVVQVARPPSLPPLPRTIVLPSSQLWTDKYKPKNLAEVIGQDATVKKLELWLRGWHAALAEASASVAHTPASSASASGAASAKKSSAAPKKYLFKRAALLSGPPGIGKTTTAHVVARVCGFDVYELNASDSRSKNSLRETLAPVLSQTVLGFGGAKPGCKRVIIMDEVDGMSSGDRGGNAELIALIRKTHTPIIAICNDRLKDSVRSLADHCLDLKFGVGDTAKITQRVVAIALAEGLRIEPEAVQCLVSSTNGDIRQILNVLMMWQAKFRGPTGSPSAGPALVSTAEVRSRMGEVQKDELLRVTALDAVVRILSPDFSGVRFADRCDAFFVDYDMVPLMVHMYYPHTVLAGHGREAPLTLMNRTAHAAELMSLSDIVSTRVRKQQAWKLLPVVAALNVDAAMSCCGPVSGGLSKFPEWLAKQSSANKRSRLLSELSMHLNCRVTGGRTGLRLDYFGPLLGRLYGSLVSEEGVADTVALLDSYGLSRDDMFEALPEMACFPSEIPVVDSKIKTAFTRTYNKLAHRSQHLVELQAVVQRTGKGKGKKAATSSASAKLGTPLGKEGNSGDEDDNSENEERELDEDF